MRTAKREGLHAEAYATGAAKRRPANITSAKAGADAATQVEGAIASETDPRAVLGEDARGAGTPWPKRKITFVRFYRAMVWSVSARLNLN